MWRFLVVEDEPEFVEAFREGVAVPLAERADFEFVADLAAAREALRKVRLDHLILDIAFPLEAGGRPDPSAGLRLLAELPALAPGLPATVLSGQERKQAVELLLSRKVEGYLFKDYGFQEVAVHLEKILETLELKRTNRLLREGAGRHPHAPVVGPSSAMQELLHRARQVAVRDTTVLVTGESGTGKEVLARSQRGSGPGAGCGRAPHQPGGDLVPGEELRVATQVRERVEVAPEGLIPEVHVHGHDGHLGDVVARTGSGPVSLTRVR